MRRHWRAAGRAMQFVRVAADDEHGLRLWLPAGSPFWRLTTRTVHGSSPGRRRAARGPHRRDDLDAGEPARTRSGGSGPTAPSPAGTPTSRSPTSGGPTGGCAGVDTADQALDWWSARTALAVEGRGRVPRPHRPPALLDSRPGRPIRATADGWSGSPRRPSSRSTAPGAASAPTRLDGARRCRPATTARAAARPARLTRASSARAASRLNGGSRRAMCGVIRGDGGADLAAIVMTGIRRRVRRPLPGRVAALVSPEQRATLTPRCRPASLAITTSGANRQWPSRSGFCGWARSATRSTASSSPTRAPSATAGRSSTSGCTTRRRSPRASRSTPSGSSTGSRSARSRASRWWRSSARPATGRSSRACPRRPSR